MTVRGSDICIILCYTMVLLTYGCFEIAILFPPAAVAIMTGCSCDLLINILLTILGYFPGHIHAFWLIYRRMKAEEQYGRGGFVYVGNGEYQRVQHPTGINAGAQPNYGTTAY
ncbi:hypothetical protein Clacol_004400 [Clathrus columnatus]|uniref:Uncharacterized protein n=1 Tax=Clathrus columnatus TaxID=1419009 RepID=A0AAV5AAB9_9AGAM|nr:hypothetical protein Clacol_004400 [Clathrus columnatus]